MDEQCLNLHQQVTQLAEGLAENRTEHWSFRRRLDDLEENGKRQTEILLTLQRQADAIESINSKIDKVAGSVEQVAGRVSEMEKEPADKWKKLAFEIIKYIVLAAVGVIAGYFLK
ncbi:MAG: hypothetical protein IJ466_03905 [Clostridia bacterium]|nr:hypothetical protein [Clostridia bacterium]